MIAFYPILCVSTWDIVGGEVQDVFPSVVVYGLADWPSYCVWMVEPADEL